MNNINIKASQKTLKVTIYYSKKALVLLQLLYKWGCLTMYYVHLNSQNKKLVSIFPAYYKSTPLTKKIKLISTPSRTFYISFSALKLLNTRLGSACYILSTNRGLITHREAIQKKIGGVLVGFFFI